MVISCAFAEEYPRDSITPGTVEVNLESVRHILLIRMEVDLPVDTDSIAPETDDGAPDLPFLERSPDMAQVDAVCIRDSTVSGTSLNSQPVYDKFLFLLCEEGSFFRTVW